MTPRLVDGWLFLPGTDDVTARIEIRVNDGPWQPAYHEAGQAVVRYDGTEPIRWATRINGQDVESGTIGRARR